eukprot:130195_1
MDYSQTQHHAALYHINGYRADQTRMHSNFTHRSPCVYPPRIEPQLIQSTFHNPHPQHMERNVNRAAAIIDTEIAISSNHRQQYSAPPLNLIHTNSIMQQTPYVTHHYPFDVSSKSYPHAASNINLYHPHHSRLTPQHHANTWIHSNHTMHKQPHAEHHKYNPKYNPHADPMRDTHMGRDYRFNKYDRYHKYNDSYVFKKNGNMSYYDDHATGRSQRDRDTNKVVAFSTTNVYVNGIPRHWNYAEVEDYFSRFGTILSVNLWRDHGTGYSRGSGFVDFKNPYSAEKCIKEMKGMRFKNCKPLIIKYADVRNQKYEANRRRDTPEKNGYNYKYCRSKSRSKSRCGQRSKSRSRSRSRSRERHRSNEQKYDSNGDNDHVNQNGNTVIEDDTDSKECGVTVEKENAMSLSVVNRDEDECDHLDKSPSISSEFSNIDSVEEECNITDLVDDEKDKSLSTENDEKDPSEM